MIESDIADLVSFFLSTFGVGWAAGILIRTFRKATDILR